MKLTITNIEVNLYSELADSFCVSGDVLDTELRGKVSMHCHFYVSRQDRRTLPPASGTGYPIIYVNKGHDRPRRTDSVWGKAFVEMTMKYADESKLWDAAEAAIAEKAIQEQKANVERRKIARMRDHAEQMYTMLKNVQTELHHHLMPSERYAIRELMYKIDNDLPQASNETP